MNDEVLIAIYVSRAEAERARDGLLKLGVPATNIGLSTDVPTAIAAAADDPVGAPGSDNIPDRVPEEGEPNDCRTAVAVHLDRGNVDRERIVDALEACGPLGFEGDTAATATETDLIEPEPAGWVSERIGGIPSEGINSTSIEPAPLRNGARPSGRYNRVRSYLIPRTGKPLAP